MTNSPCCSKCQYVNMDTTGKPFSKCVDRSCECHTQPPPDWEAEFDQQFKTPGHKLYQRETIGTEIKEFIRNLLTTRDEQLIAVLEGMKRDEQDMPDDEEMRDLEETYNQAVEDIIETIKTKKV